MGKRCGKVSTEQRFINRALIEAARTHAVVVRLKGGDPMLFGRAQEELEALREAGIEHELVPGVTAALAAAATLGVSLTRRGVARSVAFLTPRVGQDEAASEWLPAAIGAGSVVLYMAAGASQSIASSLIGAGKPAGTPVALVESATLAGEKRLFTTLGALRDAALARAGGAGGGVRWRSVPRQHGARRARIRGVAAKHLLTNLACRGRAGTLARRYTRMDTMNIVVARATAAFPRMSLIADERSTQGCGFHDKRRRERTTPDDESEDSMMHAVQSPGALEALLEALRQDHFPATDFTMPRPGTVAARFLQSRVTSAFQPIVRASDGGIAGHHALLRVSDRGEKSAAPWRVLAQAATDDMLVQLDRLCRTVHALNYFPREISSRTLYLNVDPRLLAIVDDDHGAYFDLILVALGIAPKRVAIVLPADALDDPVTFVRAAISYRMRGYRVVAQHRSLERLDLEHLFLAEPHDVAFDAPRVHESDETRRIVAALARRGIHAIARQVEDEEQAQAARDVGFTFLQGWHVAAAAEPLPPSILPPPTSRPSLEGCMR